MLNIFFSLPHFLLPTIQEVNKVYYLYILSGFAQKG